VPDQGLAYQMTQLPTGARFIVAPMRERASVALAVMFAAGSRHEAGDQCGLAHFIEHMVFKGSRRYPTSREISEAIEGVGGSLNAATDKELTMFWARVPADQVGVAVDVLADMVFAGNFDPEEVAKERQVVIEELRMYLDNPQEHVHTVFDEVMWPDHPLGRDTAGTEETVRSFTREDCLGYLREQYHADALLVSVAGAVDTDEVMERMVPVLGSWGDGARPRCLPAEPVAAGPSVRLVSRRTEQANMVVGTRGCSYLDADRFVLDMLTTILGEGMSSRLFMELRERRGLVYDVHAFTTKHRDTGALGIYVGCEPQRAPDALAAVVAELSRLAAEPVGGGELQKAREFTKGRMRLQLEATGALCNFLGQQELLMGEILTPVAICERLDAVSPEQIQAVAGKLLSAGLRSAVVGPFPSARKFEKVLAQT